MSTEQIEYWRVADISNAYRIGKSTVWKWSSEGKLPQSIKLSNKCTVWKKSEVVKAFEDMMSVESKALDQKSIDERVSNHG